MQLKWVASQKLKKLKKELQLYLYNKKINFRIQIT